MKRYLDPKVVTGLKVILGFALVIDTWKLLQTDTVMNAIMLFGTAGVIPGTAVVLSPDQVMAVLGGLLLISILSIFYKEIGMLLRKLLRRPAVAVKPASVNIPPAHLVRVRTPRRSAPIRLFIAQKRKAVAPWVQRLGHAAAIVRVVLSAAGRIMGRSMVKVSVVSMRLLVYTWHWLEPHLRRFDAWLEKITRRYVDVDFLQEIARDTAKTCAMWWRRVSQSKQ